MRNNKDYDDIHIPFILKELIIVFIIVTFHWVFISFSASEELHPPPSTPVAAITNSLDHLENAGKSLSHGRKKKGEMEGAVVSPSGKSRKLPTPPLGSVRTSPLGSSHASPSSKREDIARAGGVSSSSESIQASLGSGSEVGRSARRGSKLRTSEVSPSRSKLFSTEQLSDSSNKGSPSLGMGELTRTRSISSPAHLHLSGNIEEREQKTSKIRAREASSSRRKLFAERSLESSSDSSVQTHPSIDSKFSDSSRTSSSVDSRFSQVSGAPASYGASRSSAWDVQARLPTLYNDPSAIEDRSPKETNFALNLLGGGVRALMQAQVIYEFEQRHHINLARRARVVAAASGGAINAFSHLMPAPFSLDNYKYTAEEIVNSYGTDARRIFKVPFMKRINPFRGFFGPLYDQENLRAVLQEKFGDVRLSDIGKSHQEIIVPVGRRDAPQEIYHFKSSLARKEKAHNYFAREALWAAGAPPVFFDPPFVTSDLGVGEYMYDGGAFANNPILRIVDTIDEWSAQGKLSMNNLAVFSIGTGVVSSFQGSQSARQAGLSRIGFRRLLSSLVSLHDKANEVTASDFFKRHEVAYMQFQPIIEAQNAKLDSYDPHQLEYLKHIGNTFFATGEDQRLAHWLNFSKRVDKSTLDVPSNDDGDEML